MAFQIVRTTDPLESGRPLRVLHVIDHDAAFRLGGMLAGVVHGLWPRLIHAEVLTDAPREMQAALGPDVPLAATPALSGWKSWRLETRTLARLHPPDVVHLWGAAALGSVGCWSRRRGLPTVAYVTSEEDVAALQRHGVHANEHLLAAEASLRQAVEGLDAALVGTVEPLAPGFALPSAEESAAAQAPPAHIPAVVWVGPWRATDALQVLCEAVALLDSKGLDLQVALAGFGPQRHAAWRMVRQQGMERRFSGVDGPGVADLAVRGADVLVLPARERAVSIAPLLAMARGAFVICSRDQSLEWYVDGESTLQFAPGSSKELAYQLTRVLEQRSEVQGLRSSSAAYARPRFDVAERLGPLEHLYRRLAVAAPVRGPA